MQKDAETIKRELAMPFAPEDLEWRLQQAFEDKQGGLAVPFVTNRAIQDRLDDTVGPENWHNDFKPWHSSGKKEAQICGISVYFEERKEWVTKWDGAEDSDIEPIKGGLSDSMKRAAVQWGIGRVLYKMDAIWVDIKKRGKSWVIRDDNRPKLDKAYLDTLARLHLTPAKAGGLQSQLTPRNDPAASRQDTPPATQPQGKPTPQPARRPQNDAPNTSKTITLPQRPRAEFVIADVRVQKGMSSTNTSLILEDPEGKRALAYVQGPHPELKPGMELFNVKKELKQQDSVVFYLLHGYDCAAEQAA